MLNHAAAPANVALPPRPGKRSRWPGRRFWAWVGVIAFLSFAALFVTGEILLQNAGPILKGRVIETLEAQFHSKVELDKLEIELADGLHVSGAGLRIYPPDDVVNAGASAPLISVAEFQFRTPLRFLWLKPMRIRTVHVSGLTVRIPPRNQRSTSSIHRKLRKIKIIAGRIDIQNSVLVLETDNPHKDPKRFLIRSVLLEQVGSELPWHYNATLVNAIPKGDIHSVGSFGPWNTETPGDSHVDGDYTFQHADLGPIKGIGGTLDSTGHFVGQLDRIVAEGTTHTPNFTLDSANEPMPLETTFHATIDGINGDTFLDPVHARLGRSQFTCRGRIVNVRGAGHVTDLYVDVPNGSIGDFLRLAVRTRPPVLNSTVSMRVHIHVAAGKESVTRKLQMQGSFALHDMHFSNPKVQEKIDDLSLRAQGHPRDIPEKGTDAAATRPETRSAMTGTFDMHDSKLTFPKLDYTLPGAHVLLNGIYTLDGKQFDFHGTLQTQAKISQMVASGWKRFLLKAVDPFFEKGTSGAVIPIQITGTQSAPKFGLDLHHMGSDNNLHPHNDRRRADGEVVH